MTVAVGSAVVLLWEVETLRVRLNQQDNCLYSIEDQVNRNAWQQLT